MKEISKTAKVINRILGVFYKLTVAAAIVVIVVIGVLMFADPADMIESGTMSVTLGVVEVYLTSGFEAGEYRPLLLWLLAAALLCTSSACYVLYQLRKIFSLMEDGTPFDRNVSKMLRKFAWLVLGFGIVFSVLQTLIQTQIYKVFDVPALFDAAKVSSCVLSIKTDGSFILVFALLYLLSHIFRYGEELQQLSDETL